MKSVAGLFVLFCSVLGITSFMFSSIVAQPEVIPVIMPKGKPKGLVIPANVKQLHAASWERHKHVLKALPNVTATSFDCRTMGWVPAFDDQGDCGDCWVFSGADPCASAFIKAGFGKDLTISKQHLLDCHFRDACGGGWPEDVAKVAKSSGVYTDADYGVPYKARPSTCKSIDASKLLKIADYGFCSQSDGVGSYQDFKNAMVKFGVISVCYDASGTPSSGESGPVWRGNGGRSVDHAIKAIAFDDSKSPKGAILCWNQWYNGSQDLFWCEWGANEMGTSAMWVTATSLPPIPPGPTPPGPTPDTLNPGSFTLVPSGTYTFTVPAISAGIDPAKVKGIIAELQALIPASKSPDCKCSPNCNCPKCVCPKP